MSPLRRGLWAVACVLVAWWLAGCSSTPTRSPGGGVPASSGADGPPPPGSPDPMSAPDAEPRVEPIRQGGPNKPYEVMGQTYVPLTTDAPLVERGLASWYGRKFHGRPTASGEAYNMHSMTAAHKTMPIPSYARVRNPANGREVIVRVNDRGPFAKDRVIDVSWAAAVRLGIERGVREVEVQRITHDEIRAGNFTRREPPSAVPPAAAVGAPVVAALPAPPVPVVERSPPTAARAATPAASGYWLQLGAFSRQEGAVSFQQHVAAQADWLAPLLAIFRDGALHRLQAGPYPSREQAREAAERVREALQLVPVVLERR